MTVRRYMFSFAALAILLWPIRGESSTYSETRKKSFSTDAASKTFEFAGLPSARSKVRVTVELWGAYWSKDAGGQLYADVGLDGIRTERMCTTGCRPRCASSPHSTVFQVRESSVADGTFEVQVDNSELVRPCRRAKNQIRVGLEYDTNEPPTARDLELRTREDTPVQVDLQGSDPDGDSLEFTILAPPDHGALTGSFPTLTYVPAPNYAGTDSFRYRASDGSTRSDPATGSIRVEPVNDPPEWLVPDQPRYRTPVGQPFQLDLRARDVDDDSLEYRALETPSKSTFSQPSRRFEWVPTSDDIGVHDVEFSVTDGDATVPNAITVDVVAGTGDADDTERTDISEPTPDDTAEDSSQLTYRARGGGGCSSTSPTHPSSLGLLVLLGVLGLRRRF